MSPSEKMSAQELRASIGLSSIFGLRMLGMFVILTFDPASAPANIGPLS